MNVALVHDWVVTLGGAERALRVLRELWPEAPLYTLVYKEDSLREIGFTPSRVWASFLQRFPGAERHYRKYLAFYPLAIESFDLSRYDVVFSSSHAAAKGVLVRADQLHICYCHTPMRYAWDLTHQYLRENNLDSGIKGCAARTLLHYLRLWDSTTSARVDFFLANSTATARRIWRAYRRTATVVYGPVDIDRFKPSSTKGDYFIFVSRLVPYKQTDLVIRAFNALGLPLVVVGDGPEYRKCRELAKTNVKLLGYQDDNTVAELMAEARALVFAAEEDLGLVPIEAQACGTPVVAFGKGGTLDTVIPATGDNWESATGVFFYDQSEEAIQDAVRRFLEWERHFQTATLRRNAERFGRDRFKERIASFVSEKWEAFRAGNYWAEAAGIGDQTGGDKQ